MKRIELKRRTPLKAKLSGLLEKVRAPLKKVNRKRKAKMHARNFEGPKMTGRPDKDDWIRGCPCDVTGLWPVEAAHAIGRGMGGAGGDSTVLVPLIPECHRDYDGNSLPYLDDEAFYAKWGRTRESIRNRAPFYEQLWQQLGAAHADGGLSF